MTKDGLDSEVDYVRASPKATGSREEDVALLLPRIANPTNCQAQDPTSRQLCNDYQQVFTTEYQTLPFMPTSL